MKTHTLSLAGITIYLLVASCLLAGCVTKRTIKNQTGVIHKISGGSVVIDYTNNDLGIIKISQTKTAFFILKTSLGDFAFTSDDSRKPEAIVADFSSTVSKLSNEHLGENGSVTILIYHTAYHNWQVYSTERRVFVNFSAPQLVSFSKQFWIRKFLKPPSDFIPDFERSVDVTFIYNEETERDPANPTFP